MPIKFLMFRGGYFCFFVWGGGLPFYFMGAGICLISVLELSIQNVCLWIFPSHCWVARPRVLDPGGPPMKCHGPCQEKCANTQGGKKNPNPNFLVRIFSSGVGVFHVNGWGPKSSIRPSKPGKSNFLGGLSRDFAGISRRCPKSF